MHTANKKKRNEPTSPCPLLVIAEDHGDRVMHAKDVPRTARASEERAQVDQSAADGASTTRGGTRSAAAGGRQ